VIPAVEVARVKNGTDLVALIQSKGIELRKKGRSWQGRCPFHTDGKTPSLSVTPEKGLWQCFGCGAGGDAIRFLQLHDKLSFREATMRLSGKAAAGTRRSAPAVKEKTPPATVVVLPRTPAESKLLERVVDFYRRSFEDDGRGAAYLREQRGIRDATVFETYRLGLCTGKLRETLPPQGEIVDGLRSLGVVNDRGVELLYGCIVFPLLGEAGEVVSLYGRRILEGETRHLYLPGPRRGIFNRHAAKAREVILVEGIVDALALISCGYTNTLALDGTEGLREEHLALLRAEHVAEAYLCLDGDAAGRAAAEKVAIKLREAGIAVHVVALPDGKDPADIVKDGGGRAFEAILRAADPTVGERQSMPFHASKHGYARTSEGFRVTLGGERVYEVRGIARAPGHLRCAVRAARGARFHLDALDLYSARARQALVRAAATIFGVAEPTVNEDLARVVEYAEAWEALEAPAPVTVEVPPAEKAEALSVLRAPDLLERIRRDMGGLPGGDSDNRLLGYLAGVSRKLAEPLSVLVLSRAAAGKSHLADAITRLVPAEDLRKYTRVTGQALFYSEEDALKHKLVAIEESAGAEEAAYSIRTLQSAGELTVAVTTKDPRDGRMRTDEYKVKGPASFLVTSTSSELDPETQSRFLVLTVDESKAATERILVAQREAGTLDGLRRRREEDVTARRHQAMQRLLEPVEVVIPFAKKLRFPTETLRARRDHKKYLGLIQTVAFLHQHQRERKAVEVAGERVTYIEARPSDVAFVNRLAAAAFARTLDDISPQGRALLGEIKALCEEQAAGEVLDEYTFKRRDLRRVSRWSETQLRQYLGELEQHELVEPVMGRQGKEYLYHLAYDEEGRALALDLSSEAELTS
jgi:DNA primase